jgi:hypothetical protein
VAEKDISVANLAFFGDKSIVRQGSQEILLLPANTEKWGDGLHRGSRLVLDAPKL